MNHDILKLVINDYHQTIMESMIVDREIDYEESASYVLVGPRRAGKSYHLYQEAIHLIKNGVSWDQIIFINFDDDRILEFTATDFNDIVLVAKELCGDKKPYYFLDEIQLIDGWETFAKRLVNTNEKVFITGSNAKMLSHEIESRLGGRYLSKMIYPYSFREYAKAYNVSLEKKNSANIGALNRLVKEYFTFGGFPATINYKNKKEYVSSIYEKILFGDIITRNAIRNVNSLRILVKKIAETVRNEVSYSKLHNTMKSIGFSISKDTVIDYVGYISDSFLVFKTENFYASFVDKESNPRFYFIDNGILNLFLIDKDSSMLENLVAIALKRNYEKNLYYIKSSKTNIDIDFFVSTTNTAIQVCYSTINEDVLSREIDSLVKFAKHQETPTRLLIVTYGDKKEIDINGIHVEIIPLLDFLLSLDK